MSNDELPGFIEDQPKPTAPAAPAAPTKHFDAFADVASQPASNDAEIKPGSGKDLWACPHCRAKSKPERTTCRVCGKSPSDPVIIPWHAHPLAKPAIAVAVILIVLLLGSLLFGGGVRLVEAEAASIDSSPRTGSGAGAPSELDGQVFTPRKRYGVCGRVVGMQSRGNLYMLVLALGADGKDETRINEVGIDFSGSEPVTIPEIRSATLLCFGELPALGKGQVVSLIGDVGSLAGTEGPVVRIERAVAY